MGITEQFNLANSHAHANLVGFVASVAFGLIYRAFPAMKSSRLATAQFWIYEIGAVVLVLGKAIVDNGGSNTVVKIGSLIVILGAVLMLVVFAKDRQGA
jgi:cbb3-type cytochrome oxidase subunit 1